MKQRRFDAMPDAARRRRLVLGGLAAISLAPLASCGGGTELLFVPFFSFTFNGTGPGNQAISFALFTGVASGCTVSGSFVAGSGVTYAGVRTDITGTFNSRRIDINLAAPRAGLAAAYIGQFIDDATVMMSPVGGDTPFNVVRTPSARPDACPASG